MFTVSTYILHYVDSYTTYMQTRMWHICCTYDTHMLTYMKGSNLIYFPYINIVCCLI